MRGVFVTGTDTDAGKTYVACLLAQQLASDGVGVIPKKPVESGCNNQQGELIPADALALKQAAALDADLSEVCAYRFEAALSPVRAAQLENKKVSIEQLAQVCEYEGDGFLMIEGAGGFYSPLASDGLNADLAESLQLPVLLVAENKLGCINQVLLTAEAISKRGLKLAAVVLNKKDLTGNQDMDNAEDLRGYISAPIYLIENNQNNPEVLTALSQHLLSL